MQEVHLSERFVMGILASMVLVCLAGDGALPRNFDAVYPRGELAKDAVAAVASPYGLTRPWYLAPYRYYSYYRPWYTYGYYGPTYYRYHYAPSWGYRQPWYGPQYLNPDAIAPPAEERLYHW
jgi:hypothetical protein